MKKFDWDDVCRTVFLFFVVIVLFIVVKALTFNHVVRSYYLNGSEHKPQIMGDVDWAEDRIIDLPDTVSFPEAIKMIEDLNKSLVK